MATLGSMPNARAVSALTLAMEARSLGVGDGGHEGHGRDEGQESGQGERGRGGGGAVASAEGYGLGGGQKPRHGVSHVCGHPPALPEETGLNNLAMLTLLEGLTFTAQSPYTSTCRPNGGGVLL